jgi:hypothetical protein
MKRYCAVFIFIFLVLPLCSAQTGSSNPFVQNVFNPDMALIIDTAFARSNVEDSDRARLEIPGFLDHVHTQGKTDGFNFNYLEFSFYAPVDPYFELFAVVSREHEQFEIEEAYVNTLGLPGGFNVRLGRFLSAFGRLNEQHKHYWDFYDAPLAYEGILGPHGLGSTGARIFWTAPTNFLLTAGTEILQGDVEENPTFGNDGFTFGGVKGIDPAARPSLCSAFLKSSFDRGDDILLLGASLFYGPTRINHGSSDEDEGDAPHVPHAVSADGTKVFGLDFTYKHLIDSYRSVTVQSEFLAKRLKGTFYRLPEPESVEELPIRKTNAGFYSQIVWRFDRYGRWRTGFRYDLLFDNHTTLAGTEAELPGQLSRYTAMLEFNPTEFSRIRFQYDYDRSRFLDEKRLGIHEFLLQFNFSIGAHGAHKF